MEEKGKLEREMGRTWREMEGEAEERDASLVVVFM